MQNTIQQYLQDEQSKALLNGDLEKVEQLQDAIAWHHDQHTLVDYNEASHTNQFLII